jgi:GTP-binding protein
MKPLFEAIVKHVPAAGRRTRGPFQMQITALDYSATSASSASAASARHGQAEPGRSVVGRDGEVRTGKVLQVLGFMGLERIECRKREAGDIVAITGIEDLGISDTICDLKKPEQLPRSGRRADHEHDLPGQQLAVRGQGRQVRHQPPDPRPPAARAADQRGAARRDRVADADKFKVSGRGELHLGILLENMRREGYELAVSRPEVIQKEIDGVMCEPYELRWWTSRKPTRAA